MVISDKVRNQTTAYAKDELISYLTKMAGLHNLSRIDLELINENEDNEMAPDRYIIDITDGKGTIKGSNSRSILLGVYAYLKHLGCRFLRPGKLGEIVPKSDLKGDFKVDLTASYNHRIEVMEGAINDDIVIEILKWLPKVGYNGYFIQFVTPHIFLKRWHYHELNPYKTPEEFSFEDADEETVRIEKFAKLLGFQLWGVGHGYMFLPFGMNYGPEWTTKLSEEAKPYVAEINGVRAVRGGNINYTNLCYSDPVVKEKMADFFVDYMKNLQEEYNFDGFRVDHIDHIVDEVSEKDGTPISYRAPRRVLGMLNSAMKDKVPYFASLAEYMLWDGYFKEYHKDMKFDLLWGDDIVAQNIDGGLDSIKKRHKFQSGNSIR